MKYSSLTQDEFDSIHPVLCYLHRGEGDKTDEFLIEKFGKPIMDLTRKWLLEQPTQEEIEKEREKLIKAVIKKYGKKPKKKVDFPYHGVIVESQL